LVEHQGCPYHPNDTAPIPQAVVGDRNSGIWELDVKKLIWRKHRTNSTYMFQQALVDYLGWVQNALQEMSDMMERNTSSSNPYVT
jgi:hypothetical protein